MMKILAAQREFLSTKVITLESCVMLITSNKSGNRVQFAGSVTTPEINRSSHRNKPYESGQLAMEYGYDILSWRPLFGTKTRSNFTRHTQKSHGEEEEYLGGGGEGGRGRGEGEGGKIAPTLSPGPLQIILVLFSSSALHSCLRSKLLRTVRRKQDTHISWTYSSFTLTFKDHS